MNTYHNITSALYCVMLALGMPSLPRQEAIYFKTKLPISGNRRLRKGFEIYHLVPIAPAMLTKENRKSALREKSASPSPFIRPWLTHKKKK